MQRLAVIAQAARDQLAAEADRDQQKPGSLAAIRALAEVARAQGESMRQHPGQMPAADRDTAVRRELAAARAAQSALSEQLAEQRQQLQTRAHDPAASQSERARALVAREALADDVAKAERKLAEAVAQPAAESNTAGAQIETAARELDQALARADAKVAAVERERTAAMARETTAGMPKRIRSRKPPRAVWIATTRSQSRK
jgi:chromosome segregation ATPase